MCNAAPQRYTKFKWFTFLPVTVNQNLASATSGGFFIFAKTGIWQLILWLHFLAVKNTQLYRILILGK